VGDVNREMGLTFATVMLRVVQNGFDGTTGRRIAEIVKLAVAKCMSSAWVLAVGAPALFADAGTLFERRLRQIGGIENTFGGIGNVVTRNGHS